MAQKHYLVATQDTKYWPTDGEVWMLVPGCLSEEHNNNLDTLSANGSILDPYQSAKKIDCSYKKINQLAEWLLDILAAKLNKVHGENNELIYWRTLLSPWVLFYCLVMFDRYSRLINAKELKKDACLFIVDSHVHYEPLIDTVSFSKFAEQDDNFNQRIFANIAQILDIPIVTKSVQYQPKKTSRNNFFTEIKNILISKIKISIKKRFNSFVGLCASRIKLVLIDFDATLTKKMALFFGSHFRIATVFVSHEENFIGFDCNTAKQKRDHLKCTTNEPDPLKYAILQGLVDYLPKAYVENYKLNKDQLKKSVINKLPQNILTSSGFTYNEILKLSFAESSLSNGQFHIFQHGGDYGVKKHHPQEALERKYASKFITWGWQDNNDQNIITGFCPLTTIARLGQPKRESKNCEILYVSDYCPRFCLSRLSNYARSLSLQERFFRNVAPDLIAKIKVRLHSIDGGWNRKERLLNINNNIRFDDRSRDFLDELGFAKIYITDHLSTSWLQALTENVPTIIFWDNDAYQARDSAKKAFDKLRAANILHASPEDAARWLKKICSDPNSWWQSDDCQSVITDVVSEFARHESQNELQNLTNQLAGIHG